MMEADRLDKIKAVVDESWAPEQWQQRKEVYKDVRDILVENYRFEDIYLALYNNFPAWCAAFIDDDSGKPLIPSQWQTEFFNNFRDYQYLFALCSRKIGKSTNMAAIVAHILCGFQKERVVCFAPTHGQDFIFKKARKYVTDNAYLKETFIDSDTTEFMVAKGTGTEIVNRSLAITTGGETARGEYATIILVDEVQSIPPYIMNQIIMPIAADAYSDKKVALIGTPNDVTNLDLESLYYGWEATDPLKYKSCEIDCWVGIEQGCILESWVISQFKVLSEDEFRMEYGAKFPLRSQRYFPPAIFESIRAPYGFYDRPDTRYRYLMTVDWAQQNDNTEILIGEYDSHTNRLRYPLSIVYRPDDTLVDDELITYRDKVEAAKRCATQFGVTWVCPDSTTSQISLTNMLTENYKDPKTGRVSKGIPQRFFYGYDKTKKPANQRLGYIASASLNSDTWTNHRDQIMQGNILLPEYEYEFTKRYIRQHVELQQTQNSKGLVTLKEQRGGKKDLAVAAAYMSLFFKEHGPNARATHLAPWKTSLQQKIGGGERHGVRSIRQ